MKYVKLFENNQEDKYINFLNTLKSYSELISRKIKKCFDENNFKVSQGYKGVSTGNKNIQINGSDDDQIIHLIKLYSIQETQKSNMVFFYSIEKSTELDKWDTSNSNLSNISFMDKRISMDNKILYLIKTLSKLKIEVGYINFEEEGKISIMFEYSMKEVFDKIDKLYKKI